MKLLYHEVIRSGLLAGKFTMYQGAFEKILNGQDPQKVVNDVYEEFQRGLGGPNQDEKAAKGRKPCSSRGQRTSKTANYLDAEKSG